MVVDFWATWCGPCIASFPHMRELVDKYKDQLVVILGVTSPQGYVVYPKAKDPKERKVDTKEQKDELERMPAWVKEMDMTWTVAVSTENCFNPDFGVQGIPAMAIIDAKGIVRFNKLSPRSNEVVEDIDTLLKEMKDGAPAEKDEESRRSQETGRRADSFSFSGRPAALTPAAPPPSRGARFPSRSSRDRRRSSRAAAARPEDWDTSTRP